MSIVDCLRNCKPGDKVTISLYDNPNAITSYTVTGMREYISTGIYPAGPFPLIKCGDFLSSEGMIHPHFVKVLSIKKKK